MRKHPTSRRSLISAQERARKGHRERRADNERLEETGPTAESPGSFFPSFQYLALNVLCFWHL